MHYLKYKFLIFGDYFHAEQIAPCNIVFFLILYSLGEKAFWSFNYSGKKNFYKTLSFFVWNFYHNFYQSILKLKLL